MFRLALEEPAGRPIRRAAQSSSSLRARVSEGLARWDAALEAAPGLSPLAAALAWLRPWLAGLCATPSHSQLLCAHIARDLVDDCRHLYARVSVDACGACGAEGLGGLLRGEWGGWWRRRLLGHIVGGAAGSNADPSGHSLGLRAIAAALLAETRRVAGRSTAGCAVVLCCAAAALCTHTSLAMTDVDALLAACAALAPTDCPARPAVETCVAYVRAHRGGGVDLGLLPPGRVAALHPAIATHLAVLLARTLGPEALAFVDAAGAALRREPCRC